MTSALHRRALLRTVAGAVGGTAVSGVATAGDDFSVPGLVRDRRFERVESFGATVTTDDGVVIAGNTETGAFLAGVSLDGRLRWRQPLDLAGTHRILDVAVISDGGLLLAGEAEVEDERYAVAYKLDAERTVEWWTRHRNRTYVSVYEAFVAEFEPGAYAFGWEEQQPEIQPTSHLTALDADGGEQWRRRANVADMYSDGRGVIVGDSPFRKIRKDGTTVWSVDIPYPDATTLTADGGFVAASDDYPGSITLSRYDATRTKQWTRGYIAEVAADWSWRAADGPDFQSFELQDVAQTLDGGFVLVGTGDKADAHDKYATFLLKTDAAGRVAWRAAYAIPDVTLRANHVSVPEPGTYVLAGWRSKGDAMSNVSWLAVLDESAPRQLTPAETTTTPTTPTRTTSTSTTTTTETPTPTATPTTTTPATTGETTDRTPTTDDESATTRGQPGFGVAAGVAGALGGAALAYARARVDQK